MKITRRGFIKFLAGVAATLGITKLELNRLAQLMSKPGYMGAPNFLWLQGQSCGGCITSFLNLYLSGDQDEPPLDLDTIGFPDILESESTLESLGGAPNSTTVEDVLLDIINLQYMNVSMSASGELASSVLKSYLDTAFPPYFTLIIEGAIPSSDFYCTIGEYQGDILGIREVLLDLIPKSLAVIAFGNCASFGNVPAANNVKHRPSEGKFESTNAIGVRQFMTENNLTTSLGGTTPINLTVCPGHPEALLLTIIDYLLYLRGTYTLNQMQANLDSFGRPKKSLYLDYNLYERTLHIDCPRAEQYAQGFFARRFGDTRGQEYGKAPCLWKLGCQGMEARTPCHTLGWNRQHTSNPYSKGGTNISCILVGMPCVGCGERGWPDTLGTSY
jgi:Ni,Fe-hydrogenase I small subunit